MKARPSGVLGSEAGSSESPGLTAGVGLLVRSGSAVEAEPRQAQAVQPGSARLLPSGNRGVTGALEVMTHACRYAVANDQSGFTAWRKNENQPPAFGNSVDIIGLNPVRKTNDEKLAGPGLFCKPDGVMHAR